MDLHSEERHPEIPHPVTFDLSSFAEYGLFGIILAWFMFRFEKKMDQHSAVINDFVETMTIDILTRPGITESAKTRAERLLERAEVRSKFLVKADGDVR
jgi:hypothetical protein